MSRFRPAIIIIVAVSIVAVLVGISFLARGPAEVPRYSASYISKYEATIEGEGYERRCVAVYPEGCFYVSTEADDARSLALIVKDIIREKQIWEWETYEREGVLYVYFVDSATFEEAGYAYAFRTEAAQEAWLSEHALESATEHALEGATVIDRVYVVTE